MEAPQTLPNTYAESELAFAAIYEIEKLKAEILSEKMASAARIKAIKAREADTYEEFRDRGLSKPFIKAVIKIREHKAKIEDIHSDLKDSGDQPDLFDNFLALVERGEAEHKARSEAREAAE